MTPTDFLTIKDFTPIEIRYLVDLALRIKRKPGQYSTALKGKTLAMIFEKQSTRTRLSFEAAMLRLGGQYVRDHLVEWVENYPSAMGNAPAPEAFPRFSLGPGQRFSSKGAYLVRFATPQEKRLEPIRDEWIVP